MVKSKTSEEKPIAQLSTLNTIVRARLEKQTHSFDHDTFITKFSELTHENSTPPTAKYSETLSRLVDLNKHFTDRYLPIYHYDWIKLYQTLINLTINSKTFEKLPQSAELDKELAIAAIHNAIIDNKLYEASFTDLITNEKFIDQFKTTSPDISSIKLPITDSYYLLIILMYRFANNIEVLAKTEIEPTKMSLDFDASSLRNGKHQTNTEILVALAIFNILQQKPFDPESAVKILGAIYESVFINQISPPKRTLLRDFKYIFHYVETQITDTHNRDKLDELRIRSNGCIKLLDSIKDSDKPSRSKFDDLDLFVYILTIRIFLFDNIYGAAAFDSLVNYRDFLQKHIDAGPIDFKFKSFSITPTRYKEILLQILDYIKLYREYSIAKVTSKDQFYTLSNWTLNLILTQESIFNKSFQFSQDLENEVIISTNFLLTQKDDLSLSVLGSSILLAAHINDFDLFVKICKKAIESQSILSIQDTNIPLAFFELVETDKLQYLPTELIKELIPSISERMLNHVSTKTLRRINAIIEKFQNDPRFAEQKELMEDLLKTRDKLTQLNNPEQVNITFPLQVIK